MISTRRLLLVVSAIVLAALACNLPGGGDAAATATAAAQATATFNAAATGAVLTESVPSAPSETPTDTATPTETPTATDTPILTPFITTDVNSNVRAGPSTVYDILGNLLKGQTADILGRNSNSTWWVIGFAPAPGGKGWIADSIVTVSGDTSNVPIVAAPPTPTPSPSGDWEGTWVTNCGLDACGEMVLSQVGDNVTGTYASGEGTLSGTITDNRLTGTWSRFANSGTFDFWLDANGEQWRGNWGRTTPWCGHREGGSDPVPCGVASWYGTWSTDCGPSNCGNMTITQDGAAVQGTYAGGGGSISGSVNGTELTGSWSRNTLSGSIMFFMLSNGDQFNGNFDGSSAWCGYRDGAGLPGQCLSPP
jgi:type II secretory pathway pseudopilin PulG